MKMSRALLVGDSHMARVESYFKVHPTDQLRLKFIAKGGTRADQTLKKLQDQKDSIQRFHPEYVIIHVGECDMLPKTIYEDVGAQCLLYDHLAEIKTWLETSFKGCRVLYSELLPHVTRSSQGRLTEEKFNEHKRWISYNKRIRSANRKQYANIGTTIQHEWTWQSRQQADPQYYDLGERWWGLHLNDRGTARLVQDFVRAIEKI